MGRVLAVDYGERRIGLALSDPTRTIATPLPTLARRRGKRPPVAAILEIAAAHDVDQFVVGLPLSLQGVDTDWTREVRRFAEVLAQRAGRPVDLIDERLTSVAAERAVRSIGLPRREKHRKDRIDAAAALLILQIWLDRAGRGHPELPA